MIYNNLASIADRFDIFLFDAYGVFWEGNGFYPNSREAMADLVKKGKTVVVISNTAMLGPDIRKQYAERGLFEGKEYNYMLSAGDLLRQHLIAGDLSFKSRNNPQKYFVIGKAHNKAFADSKYQRVMNIKEADFIYCGVPFMFQDDIKRYPQYKNLYWPVRKNALNQIDIWDTTTAKPFEDIVSHAVNLELPALNANPDLTAREGHPLVKDSQAVFVIRNGTIAEMFRKHGCEVVEFGKPHNNIYDFTFNFLARKGISIDKKHTCMVGDTIRTDIKGAINADIAPILCIETGVTAEDIDNGETIENLCIKEKIDIQQIIQIKSVGGN